ncbi:MAG: hypothetical protein M0R17_08065 [Candidatus Omnitrophica bacterium]|jgi:hypothetical protein|nr:hypothetical protein [Candidatus Omnitrophota bacterium]
MKTIVALFMMISVILISCTKIDLTLGPGSTIPIPSGTFVSITDDSNPDPFIIINPTFVNGGIWNGRVCFDDAFNIRDYSNVKITVRAYTSKNIEVGSAVIIYNAPYKANTHIGSKCAIPYANISNTGYRLNIEILSTF